MLKTLFRRDCRTCIPKEKYDTVHVCVKIATSVLLPLLKFFDTDVGQILVPTFLFTQMENLYSQWA